MCNIFFFLSYFFIAKMAGPSFFMFANKQEPFKHRYSNVLVQHEIDEGCNNVVSRTQ